MKAVEELRAEFNKLWIIFVLFNLYLLNVLVLFLIHKISRTDTI